MNGLNVLVEVMEMENNDCDDDDDEVIMSDNHNDDDVDDDEVAKIIAVNCRELCWRCNFVKKVLKKNL